MQFTNENLLKMKVKKDNYNSLYSNWYFGMFKEYSNNSFYRRSERIKDCLSVWQWDKYEKNKILDLQKVNRCNNNRFCPNCKLLDISKFIHEFRQAYKNYSELGYKAYMLTLTIPSVPGEVLRDTIDLLNKKFRKLIEKFSYDISDKRAYKDRLLKIDGGIKVLEITYNENNGFHPHFHCVVFCKNEIPTKNLEKNIKGKWSRKINSYTFKSEIDVQIGKLWSMIWYDERINSKNVNSIVYDPKEIYFKDNKKCLEVDFRELDEKGIYEVFKYTFKDSDIKNYYVFKTLVQALENKRIRQGFGILYNLKCEEVDTGVKQELELVEKEDPSSLVTREINELVTTYRDYKKISRFNNQLDNNIKE